MVDCSCVTVLLSHQLASQLRCFTALQCRSPGRMSRRVRWDVFFKYTIGRRVDTEIIDRIYQKQISVHRPPVSQYGIHSFFWSKVYFIENSVLPVLWKSETQGYHFDVIICNIRMVALSHSWKSSFGQNQKNAVCNHSVANWLVCKLNFRALAITYLSIFWQIKTVKSQ